MEQSKVTLIYKREFAWRCRKRCYTVGAGDEDDSFLLYNSDGGLSEEFCVRVCVGKQNWEQQRNKHENTYTNTRADRQQDTHENCYCCCFNNVGKTNVLRQDKQQQQQHEQTETMCNILLAACVQFKALRLLHFVNRERKERWGGL